MLNYGGVPLIDRPYDNIQQYSLPRSTKQETIDFILKDLNTSIENLAIKPITFGMGRATKGAALFLKSRVLLFTGNYKEANKVLTQLDALHAYSLMTNFADVFDPTKENNAEVVFDIQYANANLDNTSYPYYDYLKSWAGGYCPTVSLAQEFYDIRGLPVDTTRVPFAKFFANRDKRMIATLTRPGDDWGDKVYTPKSTDKKYYNSCMRVRKYLVFSDVTSTAKRSTLNIILFRYADAKLMQAECIIEDDSLFQIDNQRRNAITLLDQIRVRAGLPNIESINSSPTREELREILRRERRVELAFENSRLYDIRRWGIAMTVMNQDALGYDPENYTKGVYTTYTIDPNRKFNVHNYLWPIPQSEMDANTALTTNNPGY
jgi:starch-binding outer membrane protein, SusD/RagB family